MRPSCPSPHSHAAQALEAWRCRQGVKNTALRKLGPRDSGEAEAGAPWILEKQRLGVGDRDYGVLGTKLGAWAEVV